MVCNRLVVVQPRWVGMMKYSQPSAAPCPLPMVMKPPVLAVVKIPPLAEVTTLSLESVAIMVGV